MGNTNSDKSGKTVTITEGRVSKGGQNPTNLSQTRPPTPQGSGSKASNSCTTNSGNPSGNV